MCLSACLPVCAVRPPPGGEPLGFMGLGWRPSDSVLLSVRSLLSQPLCPSTPEARRTAPPFPRACPHTRSGALGADGQEVLAPAAGLSADPGLPGRRRKVPCGAGGSGPSCGFPEPPLVQWVPELAGCTPCGRPRSGPPAPPRPWRSSAGSSRAGSRRDWCGLPPRLGN